MANTLCNHDGQRTAKSGHWQAAGFYPWQTMSEDGRWPKQVECDALVLRYPRFKHVLFELHSR